MPRPDMHCLQKKVALAPAPAGVPRADAGFTVQYPLYCAEGAEKKRRSAAFLFPPEIKVYVWGPGPLMNCQHAVS